MKKIVFASNNSHKIEELRQLTDGIIEILSLRDIACDDDIPETSNTFEGNALQKARWVKEHYGYDCFSDDSGLEVDALDGEPGVFSARYAGPGHDSQANMKLLLENLGGETNRAARFRTVIALLQGDDVHYFEGIVRGTIIEAPRGDGGFGYDPIFLPEGCDRTFAQMSADEKNSMSHRGRAVRQLVDYLSQSL